MPGWLRDASRTGKIVWSGIAVLIAIAVIITLTSGNPGPRPTPPAAKAFTLKALGSPGHQVSLAAFAGKPLVINFFASWCTPCRHETPLLARFYRDSGGRIPIVGIDANDEAAAAQRFVRGAGVTYPVGVDAFPAATTTSYGVFALPQTFFLDARHRIVKRIIGAVTPKGLQQGVALMDRRG